MDAVLLTRQSALSQKGLSTLMPCLGLNLTTKLFGGEGSTGFIGEVWRWLANLMVTDSITSSMLSVCM